MPEPGGRGAAGGGGRLLLQRRRAINRRRASRRSWNGSHGLTCGSLVANFVGAGWQPTMGSCCIMQAGAAPRNNRPTQEALGFQALGSSGAQLRPSSAQPPTSACHQVAAALSDGSLAHKLARRANATSAHRLPLNPSVIRSHLLGVLMLLRLRLRTCLPHSHVPLERRSRDTHKRRTQAAR